MKREIDYDARREAAEEEFDWYHFGQVIADQYGWQYGVIDTYSRNVYLESSISGGDTERVAFVVKFEPGTAKVAEAYAINSKGNIFGRRGNLTQFPELVPNDEDVKPLSEEQKAILLDFARFYELADKAVVFETIHGHIVKLPRKPGTFVPGKEDAPARLTKLDAVFLQNMTEDYPIRWIEMTAGSIQVGL
jgi:hypothetical protein